MPPGWFLCLTRCVFSIFHPHQSAPCSFMHLLLIVNASTNFLIYCFMGNKFKTVLLAMVRELVKDKEQVGRRGKCVSFGSNNFLPWKDYQKKTLQVGTSHVILADQASGVKRDISKVHHHYHHFQKGDD